MQRKGIISVTAREFKAVANGTHASAAAQPTLLLPKYQGLL
jgi:hypothetical protein